MRHIPVVILVVVAAFMLGGIIHNSSPFQNGMALLGFGSLACLIWAIMAERRPGP